MSGLGRDDFLLEAMIDDGMIYIDDDLCVNPSCPIMYANECDCPPPTECPGRICGNCHAREDYCLCPQSRLLCNGCGNSLPYCDCPVDPSLARDAEDWYRNHPSLDAAERQR